MTTKRTVPAIDKEIAETKAALADAHGSETEVYARIVGYYRSVRNWNKGKRDEFNHRKMFSCGCGDTSPVDVEAFQEIPFKLERKRVFSSGRGTARYELFARKTCPNCPPVKAWLVQSGMVGDAIDVDTPAGIKKAQALGVTSAPTVMLYDDRGNLTGRAHSVAELSTLVNVEQRIAV